MVCTAVLARAARTPATCPRGIRSQPLELVTLKRLINPSSLGLNDFSLIRITLALARTRSVFVHCGHNNTSQANFEYFLGLAPTIGCIVNVNRSSTCMLNSQCQVRRCCRGISASSLESLQCRSRAAGVVCTSCLRCQNRWAHGRCVAVAGIHGRASSSLAEQRPLELQKSELLSMCAFLDSITKFVAVSWFRTRYQRPERWR